MTPPDHLVLETRTGPAMFDEVHQTLDRAWVRNGHVPNLIRISMATAAAEIAANISQYAGTGRTLALRMEIDVLPDHVVVVFTDDGKPAAIDLGEVRMPDERAKDGRGLALASAVLGGLSYHRDRSRNRWRLVSRCFETQF